MEKKQVAFFTVLLLSAFAPFSEAREKPSFNLNDYPGEYDVVIKRGLAKKELIHGGTASWDDVEQTQFVIRIPEPEDASFGGKQEFRFHQFLEGEKIRLSFVPNNDDTDELVPMSFDEKKLSWNATWDDWRLGTHQNVSVRLSERQGGGLHITKKEICCYIHLGGEIGCLHAGLCTEKIELVPRQLK